MGTYGDRVSPDRITDKIIGAANRYTDAEKLIDATLEDRRIDKEVTGIFGDWQKHASPKRVLMSSPINPDKPDEPVTTTPVDVPPSPTEVYDAAVRAVGQLVPLGPKGQKVAEEITRQVENYDKLFPQFQEKEQKRNIRTGTVLTPEGVPQIFPSGGRQWTADADFDVDLGEEIKGTRKFHVLGEPGGAKDDEDEKFFADAFTYRKTGDDMLAIDIRTNDAGEPALNKKERIQARKQFDAEDSAIGDDLRSVTAEITKIMGGAGYDPENVPEQAANVNKLKAAQADLERKQRIVRSRIKVLDQGAAGTVPKPQGYGDERAPGRLPRGK